MGLDILTLCDIQEELEESDEYYDIEDKFGLSRSFCNLICRKEVIGKGIPELDQVGTIAGTDISVFYEMTEYMDESSIEEALEFESDDEDEMLERFARQNALVSGNIPRLLETLNRLIERLEKLPDLASMIAATDDDTIGVHDYFSDFTAANPESYVDNNFGQDLRNLRSFTQYVKSQGAETVYFSFG